MASKYEVLGRTVPFVDRDREIAKLDTWLRESLEENRALGILLQGNRGVGKSRLLEEWLAGQARRRPSLQVVRAQAFRDDGPYALWRRLLAARFGLSEAMSDEEVRQAVRTQVSDVFGDRRMTEILHFLGVYLDLSFPDNPFLQTLESDPEQHGSIARRVLTRFLEEDAKRQGTLIVAEDLQWADEASVELLAELGASPIRAPLLIVAVTRPEGLAKWPSDAAAHWKHLEVTNLDQESAASLLKALFAPGGSLPPGFAEQALAMTGGNPYFLEELFRLAVDRGHLDPLGASLHLEALEELEVPLTVEDAVQARAAALDSEERTILELAAVFGSVFWVGGVIALLRAEHPEPAVEVETRWRSDDLRRHVLDILESLATREYVVRMPESWVPGEAEFAFKHSLEFELASASIRPETRTRRHFLAGQWLERRLRSRAAEVCETLAWHYRLAGQNRRAAFFLLRAGDEARARYANEQALKYYKEGLDLLPPDDLVSRMDALHNFGDVQAMSGQFAAAEETFLEMLRAAYLLDDLAKGGAALGRLGRLARHRGEYKLAERRYNEALAFFRKASDERGVASILDDLGKIAWLRGDLASSVAHHRQALEIRHRLGDSRSIAFTLANLGVVYQAMGLFQRALRSLQRALTLYEEVQDPQGTINVALNLGLVWLDLAEVDRAEKVWSQALSEARRLGDVLMQGYLLANLGRVETQKGDLETASGHLKAAMSLADDLGDRRLKVEVLRRLGRLQTAEKEWTEATHSLKEALDLARQVGNRIQEAAVLRDLGELSFRRDLYPEAEARYREALELFQTLGNRLEEAETRRALARFYEETGEPERAREMAERARLILDDFSQAANQVAEEPLEDDLEVEIET